MDTESAYGDGMDTDSAYCSSVIGQMRWKCVLKKKKSLRNLVKSKVYVKTHSAVHT